LIITEGLKICDPSRFQASIDPDLCTACGTCQDRCYFSAIENTGSVMQVIADKCLGCGLCKITCPEEAITMVEARAVDFIPQ
jgi:MinD superfamily P-loop ATPase